jgi:hypothetical protein
MEREFERRDACASMLDKFWIFDMRFREALRYRAANC